MNFRPYLCLALLTTTTVILQAQEDDEEDFDYLGYYANARNRINVGFQLRQGAKVDYRNVGNVQPDFSSVNLNGRTVYTYSNGTLEIDSLRVAEADSDGNQTSTPGGRYNTIGSDTNGNPILTGDYLAYTSGQTRYWSYQDPSQITADGSHLVLTRYTALSSGAARSGERKLNTGVEIQLSRQLSKPEARFQFSLTAGFSLNSLRSRSAASDVNAILHVKSDTYATIGGAAVPVGATDSTYSTPTFDSYLQGDGNINTTGYETTVPLSDTPESGSSREYDSGTTTVTGVWRISGAYYTLRIGPQLSAKLTHSLGISAGLGLTGAYVGSYFTANEQFDADASADEELIVSVQETSSTGKYLIGGYANVDATWEANERTGFFAGVNYETLGTYEQKLAGRTALIDVGNTLGLRGGVSIKF